MILVYEGLKDCLTKEEVVGLSLGEGLPHLSGVGLLPPPLKGENLWSAPRAVRVPVQLCVKHEHYVESTLWMQFGHYLHLLPPIAHCFLHYWISWCEVGSMVKWCNQMFDVCEVDNRCKIEGFEIEKIGRHNKYWVASLNNREDIKYCFGDFVRKGGSIPQIHNFFF